MRERRHVVTPSCVVDQHVWMPVRAAGLAEGAGHLARPDWSVDPALIEEAPRDRGELGREVAVGGDDELARLAVGDRRGVGEHRRQQVALRQLRLAEQARLDPEPALSELIPAADRIYQNLHRRILELIVDIAAAEPRRVTAQAILDALVVQERVEDIGSGPEPGPHGDVHRVQRYPASCRRRHRSAGCRRPRTGPAPHRARPERRRPTPRRAAPMPADP